MLEEIDRLLFEVQRARYTERRTEVRTPFVRPILICPVEHDPIHGFSKDLSRHGIGIITDGHWQVNSTADLRIHSVTGSPVWIRSEVRWCDTYGKGWFLTGWKFLNAGSPR